MSLLLPSSEEELAALLAGMTTEELREVYETHEQLEHKLTTQGPQTDDELHAWIKHEIGIDIPRVAVCEDHDAPFTFVSDVFFNRCNAALLMASRGGGKTYLVALIHWVNSRFKPGISSLTFGAVDKQSDRAYSHLKSWIYDPETGEKRPQIVSTLQKETLFRNGSKVEVVGSTPEQVNGPHPHVAHADEIELMRQDTWTESRNMTVAGKTRDGRELPPQDILTSTRKGPTGRMQQLIDEIDQAVAAGYKPPRKLYKYCIKETAQERPNCQRVDPEERKARLEELGMDPCSLCDCHMVKRGEWDDGSPRLLSQVCDGDFFRSRGYMPPVEIEKQFTENDQGTFEAQQLCTKPEMKFHYVPKWRDEAHCVRNYIPDPEDGPIFTSTDWGGTNPHSVHWFQLLQVERLGCGWVRKPDGVFDPVRLKEGTIVIFDEIYHAGGGNTELGHEVIEREKWWKTIVPNFRVRERFADPQGKAARDDWKNIGLPTRWHITREFDEHIKVITEYMDFDLLRVAGDRCPMWLQEVKGWRKDEKTLQQVDEKNHAMSDFRYGIANIKKLARKLQRSNQPPAAEGRRRARSGVVITRTGITDRGPVASIQKDSMGQWRNALGEPLTMRRR